MPDSAPRLVPLADGLAVLTAGWLAWWLRFGMPMAENHLLALVLGVLLTLLLLPALGAYRNDDWQRPLAGLRLALPGLAALFVVLVLLAAATKTTADFSRLWISVWLIGTMGLMGTWRAGYTRWRSGHHDRSPARILVLGCGRLAAETASALLAASAQLDPVAGFIDLGVEQASELPGPVLGRLDDLDALLFSESLAIGEIWLATDEAPASLRKRVIARLQLSALPVRYVPDLSLLNLINHRPRRIAGLTVIELNATPLDGPEAIIKATVDRVGAALLLLLLSPLLLTVVMMIRLDSPGPVLFRQARHGSHGQVFNILKFRSMVHPTQHTSSQATRNDPRVTRIGRLLRRNSIDELPQLINVLRGEMSLVGPRPHPVALNYEYAHRIKSFMQRHRVKPGMTGWAQVNGYRGETDSLEKMQQRIEHDLYYIENWSLWFDVRILLMTASMGWRGTNAY